MVGICLSRWVPLSHIAIKILGRAKRMSLVRRVANLAVRVRDWYAPIARAWLAAQTYHFGEIRLIVDVTTVGFGYRPSGQLRSAAVSGYDLMITGR